MKLEQQCASLELCKKLKELGVKQESFFNWECRMGDWSLMWSDYHVVTYVDTADVRQYISAFTVAELGEMLPKQINFGTKSISYWEWRSRRVGDYWEVYFDSYIGVPERPTQNNFRERNEADARAKMLIYLLENKLITL